VSYDRTDREFEDRYGEFRHDSLIVWGYGVCFAPNRAQESQRKADDEAIAKARDQEIKTVVHQVLIDPGIAPS